MNPSVNYKQSLPHSMPKVAQVLKVKNIVVTLCISLGCLYGINNYAVAEPAAKIVQDTQLKQQPKNNSKDTGHIAKDTQVTIQERKRAWYQVMTEQGLNGWIKMLMIKFEGDAQSSGGNGIGMLFNSMTTRSSSTTASTGVRGFSEEDLKQSVPNMAQVAQMKQFKASQNELQSFAKAGRLKSNADQGGQ